MSQASSTHAHAHAQGTHDFAAANREHFDEHATKLVEEHPFARKLAQLVVNGLRETYPSLFSKEKTETMDFACGIGMVSQALQPHVKHVVGVDISQGSVDVYNQQAEEKGIGSEIKAVCANLQGQPGELYDAKFDLIVCSVSYHHFEDILAITRTLAFFLKPGGSLLIVDIKAAPDGRVLFPETHLHLVPHKHGLTKETVRKTFEEAGLVQFVWKDMPLMTENPYLPDAVWFIARGVKPAGEA